MQLSRRIGREFQLVLARNDIFTAGIRLRGKRRRSYLCFIHWRTPFTTGDQDDTSDNGRSHSAASSFATISGSSAIERTRLSLVVRYRLMRTLSSNETVIQAEQYVSGHALPITALAIQGWPQRTPVDVRLDEPRRSLAFTFELGLSPEGD